MCIRDRVDTVSAAGGIAGRGPLFELMEASAEKQPGKALEIADNLYSMSKDMARLCSELTDQFRNLMLLKVCPEKSLSLIHISLFSFAQLCCTLL